jgi:hypothetical protein
MARRKTTKVQSKRIDGVEAQSTVVATSSNGDSAISSTAANQRPADFARVQLRAYEIFIARGGIHGHDWADWFRAEQELNPAAAH